MSNGTHIEALTGGQALLRDSSSLPLKSSIQFSDLWKAPLHDFPIRDQILYQYAGLCHGMKVLEIGPGSGFTAYRVSPHLKQLTLVDVSAQNVKHLKTSLASIKNVDVICKDVCVPGLDQAVGHQFDAAYGLEIFELLPDPQTCLQNLAAVLHPGGRLLLQFPNYPPERSPGKTHFRTRAELDTALRAAGFSSWRVYALRLRPHARLLYSLFHERPLKLYRYCREQLGPPRPVAYEQSWAFRSRDRVERFKIPIHTAWHLLSLASRLGGECFDRTLLEQDIFNVNLLVIATR
jgi:SAM-dependent methyltransferase